MSDARSIMLVDDDDVFRERLGRGLRELGFEVRTAKNVEEAIAEGWSLTHETIDSANDLSITGQRICQYVQGNPNTTAVIGAGFWFAGAGECLRDLGVEPGQIRMGGFDLVPILLDEMRQGYVHLTVDQQPYYQGYLPILQLYMINEFGLSAFDVNSGKALIRPEDVDAVEAFVEMGVR